jgi:hypothetical protein
MKKTLTGHKKKEKNNKVNKTEWRHTPHDLTKYVLCHALIKGHQASLISIFICKRR